VTRPYRTEVTFRKVTFILAAWQHGKIMANRGGAWRVIMKLAAAAAWRAGVVAVQPGVAA
jgi:hypothetical protein